MITQPLVEHATESEIDRRPAVILKDERPQARSMPLGFIIMFIGIAVAIIGKKLMHNDMVPVVGALVSIAGMFWTAMQAWLVDQRVRTVSPYLSPSSRRTVDSNPSAQPKILSQSQPGKYLSPESSIFLPSITERTTNLLNNPAVAKPTQKEDAESKVR